MYKIDQELNKITSITKKSFAELGFSERNHLQEWLEKEPRALGEELLIIQKEFDGFDDTRERLDLLALDKDGNLVIIENKLNDSGRDVVWQALKYTSYCSNLNKNQIIEIYQSYLRTFDREASAADRLCEFFEVLDLNEVVVNSGNDQRIMLVAANFRKEVTSTALWLLAHGIHLQCFKVTPYSFDEELLLNVEQIIPPPEAKELMIGISAKEADEKKAVKELKSRHKIRQEFWALAIEAMKDSSCRLYDNISPSRDHWQNAGSGLSGCPYAMIFGTKEIRVELWFARSDTSQNKFIFDSLLTRKEEIENAFGQPLEWLRLDDKKSSRVQFSKLIEGHNKDNWLEMVEWLVVQMTKLELAFKNHLLDISNSLKSTKR
ncbi:DUF4268 domain-containing protein [Kangiella sp. TOML190]|uniref:DUF4268 domain-containing protein n=1 Tax=Kangiella sp. TOML190 TaxID=2931351 RepID=UPI00203EAE78|nr:DUF4268 domain-containing protein [Kangiella sp. TOML190]